MDNKSTIGVLLAVILMYSACGKADEPEPFLSSHITGRISVDAQLDTTRDYSGIELEIVLPDTSGQLTDTLLYARTDEDGNYQSDVRFPRTDVYTLTLSRHDQNVGTVNLVLAEDDTVRFNVELPDVEETAVIESAENDLYSSYERLNTGFNRVLQFANAGLITADTLNMEVRKWSDLYWDFYEKNKESFAGIESAASSIRLLEGWENELMIQRLNQVVRESNNLVPFAARIGTRHYANEYGLDRALAYIDTLRNKSGLDQRASMELHRSRIELLYDSARVETARIELNEFKEHFSNIREASIWINRFEFDLTSLSPGSEMPGFEVQTLEAGTITKESLKGRAYILEFTRLDNFLYQEQFDRNIAIYQIYKNYDIEFITVPFGANEIVLSAFFEERARLWPFAQPGSFDAEELIERYNINTIPTRILVDSDGMVVRKYEGTEYNDIIRGLQLVLNDNIEEETS